MYVKWCNIKAPWGIHRLVGTVPPSYTDAAGSASRPNSLAVGFLTRTGQFSLQSVLVQQVSRKINSEP